MTFKQREILLLICMILEACKPLKHRRGLSSIDHRQETKTSNDPLESLNLIDSYEGEEAAAITFSTMVAGAAVGGGFVKAIDYYEKVRPESYKILGNLPDSIYPDDSSFKTEQSGYVFTRHRRIQGDPIPQAVRDYILKTLSMDFKEAFLQLSIEDRSKVIDINNLSNAKALLPKFEAIVEDLHKNRKEVLKNLAYLQSASWISPWTSVNISETRGTIPYRELLDEFGTLLDHSSKRQSFTASEAYKRTYALRQAELRKGSRPRTVISGGGPVGLLTALEAFAAGSQVALIEKRKTYTRGQILRLNRDVVDRIKFFVGEDIWEELVARGIISRSPNWQPNAARESAGAAPARFEIDDVDIVRISHLEMLLSQAAKRYAQNDPENFKLYYGSEIAKVQTQGKSWEIDLKTPKGEQKLNANWLISSEGTGSELRKSLGIEIDLVSKKLFGSTIAFEIPDNFPSKYRPIEQEFGTASVAKNNSLDPEEFGKSAAAATEVGIAKIHTDPGHNMIDSGELREKVNAIFQTELDKKRISKQEFEKLKITEIPRTRFFVTGGIFYLGAELTEEQFKFFNPPGGDAMFKSHRLELHQNLMRILVKKHIPQEFAEENKLLIAEPDNVGKKSKTQGFFPIELQHASHFIAKKPGNLYVGVVGDSYASTHFFTGTGAVNGLRQATFLGSAIREGSSLEAIERANRQAFEATMGMHRRVVEGHGNAPLDGPFNQVNDTYEASKRQAAKNITPENLQRLRETSHIRAIGVGAVGYMGAGVTFILINELGNSEGE